MADAGTGGLEALGHEASQSGTILGADLLRYEALDGTGGGEHG